MKKRFASLLVAIAMLFTFAGLPQVSSYFVSAGAEFVSGKFTESILSGSTLQTNYTDEQVDKIISGKPVYSSTTSAAAYLKKNLKLRKKTICVIMSGKVTGNKDAIFDKIWNKTMAHTKKADEGDYLSRTCPGYSGTMVTYGYSRNTAYIIEPVYRTTLAQEKKLDKKIKSVIKSLKLSGKSSYVKFRRIYDYICKNVNPKDDGTSLVHTAYGAMIYKKSVCEGYATLLYRMLLEAGVDNRLITGIGEGVAHGWNIVKIGSRYYNCDPTWDSQYYHWDGKYRYMLKSNAAFPKHRRDSKYKTSSFNSRYKMATKSYKVK